MKYEERLTQWVADGASLILDNPTTAEEARQQVMVQFKKACIKLAELEDKIERGELVPAAGDENARHRAEVAERALSRLCDETMRDIRIRMYPTIGKQVRDKQELYDHCIEQAEKELAEEKGK